MKNRINSGIGTLLKNYAIIFISLFIMAFSGCEMGDPGSSDNLTDDQERQVVEQADGIAMDLDSLADLFSQLKTIDQEGGTEVNAEDITKILGDITNQYGDLQTKLGEFKALLQELPGGLSTDSLSALAAIFEMYADISQGELKGVTGVERYIENLTELAAQFQDIDGTEGLESFLAALPGLNTELMNIILPIALNDLAVMIMDAFNTMAQLLGLNPADYSITYDPDNAKVLFNNLNIQPFIDALNSLKSSVSPARAAVEPQLTADQLAPIIGFIMGLMGSGTGEDTTIDTSDPAAVADQILNYIESSGLNIEMGQTELVDFITLLLPILEQVNPQQTDPNADTGGELSINSELVYQMSNMLDAFANLLDTIVIFGFTGTQWEVRLQMNLLLFALTGTDNMADVVRSAALQIDEIALAIAQTETTTTE